LIDEDEVLHRVANRRKMITGLMFVFYWLAMCSFRAIHPGDWGEDEGFVALDFDSEYSGVAG